jgi:hypothetical protein
MVQNFNVVSEIGRMAFWYVSRWMEIFARREATTFCRSLNAKKRAISNMDTQGRTKVTSRKMTVNSIKPTFAYEFTLGVIDGGTPRKVERHNTLNLSISHIVYSHKLIKRSNTCDALKFGGEEDTPSFN